ncbi:hypothetical protein ZWY2020_022951 [Hordeum vulgare]|nr:hypothetical protein ZWY2020_022951 [Hordeum vulgare]
MKGKSFRGNRICFGRYALQALEPVWITARQIEAGRRAITRYARRGGKIWVRIFSNKPVTLMPTETCMGSGKGSPEYWEAVVKPGGILYEIGGVSETVARTAISITASKMHRSGPQDQWAMGRVHPPLSSVDQVSKNMLESVHVPHIVPLVYLYFGVVRSPRCGLGA